MWQARFYQSLPTIVQEHPKARWLFLTLTVRNMPVCELRDALQHMNKSWQRLIKRKEFKPFRAGYEQQKSREAKTVQHTPTSISC